LWYLLGLIVVGFVAWTLIKILFGVFFYLLIGAVVVGAIMILSGRGRREVDGKDRRKIGS